MQSLGKRTTMSYKMMSGGEGVCLECGAPFRGRSDKHFCSLSCKNAYHNRAQQTRRRHRSDILAVLTCNYGILEALLKEGRGSASARPRSAAPPTATAHLLGPMNLLRPRSRSASTRPMSRGTGAAASGTTSMPASTSSSAGATRAFSMSAGRRSPSPAENGKTSPEPFRRGFLLRRRRITSRRSGPSRGPSNRR